MAPQSLISVSDALCRINRHSVFQIDGLQVAEGEHWCIFGPNGAGKSILAALLTGKRHESGSYVRYAEGFDPGRDCLFVSFEEQQRLWQRDNRLDMSEYSDRAEDQGTLVRELIESGRLSSSQDELMLESLFQQLDLHTILNKGIRFLSSGQIRRVLIARSLYAAVGPGKKLVVFDDPLEAIDRESRERIVRCIEVHQSAGFTSLFLCRRQQDIPSHISHIAVLDELKLVAHGDQLSMRSSEALLGVCNRFPAIASQLPGHEATESVRNDETIIELRNVSASYGEQQVLKDVNWVMRAHDHVLIEGPNGCGKSTLLSLIDGENHKAYGQEVFLFGRRKGSGETIWETKEKFGVVSNELHNKYAKGWKVLDVVVSGFFSSVGLYDDSGSAEREAARQWLQALGVADLEAHYYHELSFGQQRIVLLARAMVKHPRILILDEPCVGLDDFFRQLILETLELIAQQSQTCIIYVSHVSDERPEFMTQVLTFEPAVEGGYTISQQMV